MLADFIQQHGILLREFLLVDFRPVRVSAAAAAHWRHTPLLLQDNATLEDNTPRRGHPPPTQGLLEADLASIVGVSEPPFSSKGLGGSPRQILHPLWV